MIGEGASAVVWSGTDAGGRPVAVKVPRRAPEPWAVEQAQLERHVLMAVRHPHLVTLRDVVPLDDGRVALVFDLVVGAVLSRLVGSRGHLRPGETVTVLTPLCEALAALHAAGGLHGDISAGNVMLTADGVPKLLDLGAARVAGAVGDAGAHGGAGGGFDEVVGTTGFVAPEVRRGSPPSPASDVFSLGALAWFCATGNGAPDTDLRLDPETISSHVGPELAAVVGACIDPDPARRPAPAALARAFYDGCAPEPVEVVLGADDAAALTHRLRLQAAADDPEPPPPSRWASVRERLRGPSSRDRHGDDRAQRRGADTGRGRLAVVLAAVAVIATLVVGALAVVRSSAAADRAPDAAARGSASVRTGPGAPTTAPPEAAPSEAAPPTATSRPAAPPTAADPVRLATAPRSDPTGLVRSLSLSRARALSAQDPSLLLLVHRQGSASWRLDTEVVRSLRSAHQRWEALRPTVAAARLVSLTNGRAVVRVRVDWADYTVVTSTGARQRRAAERGDTLDFGLVWQPQGWRLDSLSAPPAT